MAAINIWQDRAAAIFYLWPLRAYQKVPPIINYRDEEKQVPAL